MNSSIQKESFLQKMQIEKKAVRFPIKEKEANQHIRMLDELLIKGLISRESHDSKIKEIKSWTLSDDMYNKFCEIVAIS